MEVDLSYLEKSIRFIKGVGPGRFASLQRLGIESVWDMLWHVPRHYFDWAAAKGLDQIRVGQVNTVKGIVKSISLTKSARGTVVVKAWLEDGNAGIVAVWFNQRYIKQVLHPGIPILVTGKVNMIRGNPELWVSQYETLNSGSPAYRVGIVPFYPSTEGLNQRVLRSIAYQVVQEYAEKYPDIIDPVARKRIGLIDIESAIRNLHFPKNVLDVEPARRRLAFEELLLWQWNVRQLKNRARGELKGRGVAHLGGDELVEQVISALPFQLTKAQRRVLAEIRDDLTRPDPMNRLLQGDVGSGKTVVAALAAAKMAGDGYQIAFMAPTEILAVQHYNSLLRLVSRVPIRVALLTGKTPYSEKRKIVEMAKRHELDILVGTHALITDTVEFARLGLVVIDEQQRFGVKQRASLVGKGKGYPDTLVMSATPIPRTLALALCGDMDVSIIDEIPPGRKRVRTFFITEAAKSKLYQFIRRQVNKGRQVYIVCPLVEESEKQDLLAATSLQQELANCVFPELRVGLLHGRMKSPEKEAVAERFRQGLIDILVTTSVIEVGIDVANATVMVVEHAERFGLAQLHQLRGRVGRGGDQSYCILVGDPKTEEARARLKLMETTNDGFEIARADLEMRGPGDFWGVRQHGLPQFRVADLGRDTHLLKTVHREIAAGLTLNEDLAKALSRLHRMENKVNYNQ
ncbi:ATP-dependent DNA helicase RecG [Syntrophothermus lipocalidus]|uniref:ATP-dependent DNA helicase RecG n=1 Tax=Syntrophothermus lipocalidus (strain DSM 12680 / TGB-C1) TaxID=643648 RepID=D7CLT6_SYNLT|nr:ATP-dependent DNA helicase RecG [Syntrophothermus lipocalidus]ADI01671.1 ATP-dependent DNA helicase RecG [Syntrophothermus lipocalidus DSM 12680]